MTKAKYQIGQKVILNCKNMTSARYLDDNGWFAVTGTITDITAKRIRAVNDLRGTEGLYSFDNVKPMEQA
tara:strand:+ start:1085 stop:1294 length:210 start_codon:yes stop_codon:yes gene_type:complete